MAQIVEAIEHLADINRAAMVRADERAAQLGRAGGWSVAIMAGIAFTVSLILLRNLNAKLIEPLQEIHNVVAGYRRGDTHRRCAIPNASREMMVVCGGINAILDEHAEHERQTSPMP